MCYVSDIYVNFRLVNDHLLGKELFIRFAASAFRKLPSMYVLSYFPFGFEGRIWDLIVSILKSLSKMILAMFHQRLIWTSTESAWPEKLLTLP